MAGNSVKFKGYVPLSTTEAEYKAASFAAQECVWLRPLIGNVDSPIYRPTIIHGDNQSAIKLATNLVFHARTKHIEIEHHYIRECVLKGRVKVSEVRRNSNVADVFTKSLSIEPFEGFLILISQL
ncbi:hypothetical protein DVH24_020310 [Malus domestica]|uniref:RNase H type-1 domain-containing protein n=1 Tax=Malus domestica TaxID=3750 RepID=A0A498J9A1_MALDO|nr:hypothetical protein DVH24_020310 [Malus domestica]